MIGAFYGLMFMCALMIALQIRLVVLARRISEQLKRDRIVNTHNDLVVKISCDTSDFDVALKTAHERAQILSNAFEAALSIGVKP